MSKYEPLGEYLKTGQRAGAHDLYRNRAGDRHEIAASATKHRPWWSNNASNSVLTKVWLDAGYESEQVDMERRKLVFRRVRAAKAAPISRRSRHFIRLVAR